MTDVSLVHPAAEHMSPAAVALAVLLHAMVGAGVWWLSPLQPAKSEEQPIMVSFDSSPSNVGLQLPERTGPPAESPAASPQPTAEPAREPESRQALAEPAPAAAPVPARSAQPSQAPPEPEPVPTLPLFEFSVPPVPEPPPAPTSRDFPRPPATQPRVTQRSLPMPPRPAPPSQQRPAAEAPALIPAPRPGPDPADRIAGQGRQRNDYLSRVFRHLEPYRAASRTARAANQRGRVVTRVTLARDGSLLGVGIDSSSGRPALDAAEVDAIRNGAPFPPIPANMPGDPVVLILRMTY